MANIAKLLSGIFVVLLLTYAAFYGRGMGERTINDLTARANQELVNHNLVGVTVAFEASPVRRVAHLRGNLPPAQMAQAITIRSEEHTSELQSLMRISYAVFCLKKKIKKNNKPRTNNRPKTHKH